MNPDTPDRPYDDGTEQAPDALEFLSSEEWHPVFLVTEDEIPIRRLD